MSSSTQVAASGTWWLSRKTRPKASRAADGTFALTLFCFDRQGRYTVEPWRVTWAGPDAAAYWQHSAHLLQPGAGLLMQLDGLRCFSAAGKHSGAEFHANVKSMQVLLSDAKSSQNLQTKTGSSPLI